MSKNIEEFNPKPGWLSKQCRLIKKEIKTLPSWLRKLMKQSAEKYYKDKK